MNMSRTASSRFEVNSFIIYDVQFLLGKVAAVDRIEVEFYLSKGIALDPTVVPAHLENGREFLHYLDGSVVGIAMLGTEPEVEFVQKSLVDTVKRHIFHPIFLFNEVHHSALDNPVSEERLFTGAFGLYQILIVVDEQVGDFFHGEGLFLSGAADTLLNFVGSDVLALGLQFIIGALASSENLIQKSVHVLFCLGLTN